MTTTQSEITEERLTVESAARKLLAHWDEHGGPEKRGEFEGVEYWSPAGRMIDTDFVADLRAALTRRSSAGVVKGEAAELIAWLRERAKPDSGIRYGDNSSGVAEAVFFGYDAAFAAEHFHGRGAAILADALSAISPQEPVAVPVGWKLVPENLTDLMRDEFIGTARFGNGAIHRFDEAYAALLFAAPTPLPVEREAVEHCDGQLCYYHGCQHLSGCAQHSSAAPSPLPAAEGWTRDDLAEALALLDGVTLHRIKSTVGPSDDATNWRKYLADADDVLSHLSFCASALAAHGGK